MTFPGAAPHLVLAVGDRARAVAADLCGDADRYRALPDPDEAGTVLDVESRCHHRFDAVAAVGDALDCPTCASALAVAPHHSRPHGAFLGAPRTS